MIYLVRHGQTDWNIEKKMQGHTDIPLNENGRNQAKALANRIQNLKIDKIISSDLSRAKETAKIINEKFNKEIFYDKRIRERSYGDLEGIQRDTLKPEIWDIVNSEPESLNVESNVKFYERIKSFFDELQQSKENILIVTHGGVIRMTMYYMENKNKFDSEEFTSLFGDVKINNTEIFEINENEVNILNNIC